MNKIVRLLLITLCSLIFIFFCEQSTLTKVIANNATNNLHDNVYKELQMFLTGKNVRVVSGFEITISNNVINIKTGTISFNNYNITIPQKDFPISRDFSSSDNNKIFYLYANNTELVLSNYIIATHTLVPLYLIIMDTKHHLDAIDLRKLDKSEQTIDVTLVGGGKNNSSDKTTSIETALIIIRYLGGGKVVIPNGDYMVHGNIRIPNNTVLAFGENAKLILIENVKCDFILGGDKVDNIRIVGGVIDGNSSKSKKIISAINSWNGCKNWTIENIKILNSSGHGIYMNLASGIKFNNVSVENPAGIGIGVFNSNGQILFNNCSVKKAGSNGVEISGQNETNFCKGFSFIDSYIEGSGGNNLALTYISNAKIVNSLFTNSIKHAGMACKTCVYLDALNNVFSNNRDGILLNYGSSYNNIIKNILENNEQDGIDIAYNNGHNNNIANNTFNTNGVWGLYLLETKNNYISNNLFRDNGIKAEYHKTHSAEIQIDNNSSDNTIINNKFISTQSYKTKYSIFLSKTSSGVNRIIDNIFDGDFQ